MEFYGLVGEKLGHSLSPEIHNEVFSQMDIEGAYKLFEISKEDIKNLGVSLRSLNIRGVNVTIPYKETVIKCLDEISKEAKEIGAVNTIINKDGKLIGYNTDYYGFKYMLENKGIVVKGKKVIVLGTGGASKAVLAYLMDEGAEEILLVSRSKKLYEVTKHNIRLIDYEDLLEESGDIIINTTPVGMYPNKGFSPVSKEVVEKFDVLVDLIYNPLETEFLKYGKELKKVTCGGLMMLVYQGIKAEEIWQETNIKEEVIDSVYSKLIKKFK